MMYWGLYFLYLYLLVLMHRCIAEFIASCAYLDALYFIVAVAGNHLSAFHFCLFEWTHGLQCTWSWNGLYAPYKQV